MKNSILLALGLVVAHPQLSSGSAPQVLHVVMSRYYTPEDRQTASEAAVKLILKSPLGTQLHFVDGSNLKGIADLSIPTDLVLADSVPARKRFSREALALLLRWFNRSASDTNASAFQGSAFVDIPRALELVSANPTSETEAILILGSPLYHSVSEPEFSFLPDRFPTDAHLYGDKSTSVFNVIEKRQRLRNRRVFWLYPSERLFASELYRDRVERFWALFVSYQQGTFAAFTADGTRVLRDVLSADVQPVRRDVVDPTQNKIEMLRVRRIVPFRELTNAPGQITFPLAVSTNSNASERRTEQAVAQDLSQVSDEKTAIGIMWSTPGVDLDIYVWPNNTEKPLYFGNTRTIYGNFVKDYMTSNDRADYELVILNSSPESLESIRVAVNLYSGTPTNTVKGKVFTRHKGKIFTGTFDLAAKEGNMGGNRMSLQDDPHWASISMRSLRPVDVNTASVLRETR
jgi:hypothetical protein